MARAQDIERFRRPEIFLSELINDHARGDIRNKSDHVQTWYRALVIAVDVFGARLENPDGEGFMTHVIDGKSVDTPATIGPVNPKNSVKARIISNEFDQFIGDDDLRVFWPMMPEHDSVPVKPGEHIYVTFEDESYEHGLWLGKVPGDENLNYFRGQDKYTLDEEGRLANSFGDAPPNPDVTANDTDKIAAGRLTNDGRLSRSFGDEPE